MTRPLGLFLLALTMVGSSTEAAMTQQHKLTHAGFRTLYLAPLFIAMDRGIFKARNLEVRYDEIESGALSAAAVLSGAAQITSDDLMGIAPLAKQGKDFMMIYNLLDRMTMDLIVRKDVIARSGMDLNSMAPKDRAKILKGLTIGITRPAAPTDIFARYLMVEAGLNPQRDATLVQVGGVAGLSAAFRTGKIDAFMLSPPLPQTLERDGHGTIIIRNTAGDIPNLKDISYITLFTTKDYATKNPVALTAYAHSIQEAAKWINANRDEALKMLGAKWFKDTAAEALAISFDRLLPAISTTGEFQADGLLKVQRVYRAVGEDVDIDLSEGRYWTNAFVKH